MKSSHFLVLGILFSMAAGAGILAGVLQEGIPSTLMLLSGSVFGLAALFNFYNYTKSKKAEANE